MGELLSFKWVGNPGSYGMPRHFQTSSTRFGDAPLPNKILAKYKSAKFRSSYHLLKQAVGAGGHDLQSTAQGHCVRRVYSLKYIGNLGN